MSTRSRIGILHKDGSTETIYCHGDGYPEHQMSILTGHYNTIEKVRELLDLGDLSCLGVRIAPNADEEHSYDHSLPDVTVAYHRDRGEPLTQPQFHRSIDVLTASDWCIAWYYLFDAENGVWLLPIKG